MRCTLEWEGVPGHPLGRAFVLNIIRRPAVAGKFYSQDPRQLESDVRRMLDGAGVVDCQPKILIVPHAGYTYSGTVAASAFASLGSLRHTIGRVVILGTCHTRGDPLIFATNARCFDTPLG
ncbi:MAG: AmmeMemoRadiSam system protein B, partial [Pirellulaceae bacterium]